MSRPRDDLARWDQRIERANYLATPCSFAAELLRFYAEVAAFQKSLVAAIKGTPGSSRDAAEDRPFRDSLDIPALVPGFPALLSLVQRVGTPVLAQTAEAIAGEDPTYWQYLLSAYWHAVGQAFLPVQEIPAAHLFFARAFLQPYAEHLAYSRAMPLPRFGPPSCPICGAKPQVGVLREEGHGAKRSLVCSLCLVEWDYRRIVCPACGEDRFDKLACYTPALSLPLGGEGAGLPAEARRAQAGPPADPQALADLPTEAGRAQAGLPTEARRAQARLPAETRRAQAGQLDHMRVEACETCKTYIITVDLTKNGLAVPLVDELAAIPLDLWAQEQGYSKLQPNLLGM